MTNPNPQFYKSSIDATGCISNAWNLISSNYWLYFGISFVVVLILFAVQLVPFAGPVIMVLLTPPLMGGVYYVALRAMRGEPVDFGMMFKGFEKAGPLFLIGAISAAPTIIFAILDIFLRSTQVLMEAIMRTQGRSQFQAAPDFAVAGGMLLIIIVVLAIFLIISLLWAITFAFAVPIAMDQNVDALTAIKLSAKSSWSNFGGVLILMILAWLMSFGGALLCCIGLLFVLPIVNVSWAFAYRQVFPDLSPTVYRNEPPPPDAYQGSFGQGM